MKYFSAVILLLLMSFSPGKHKLPYLDRATILINGTQQFKNASKTINFTKSSKIFLASPAMRFDKSTKIEAVENMFEYDDATRGTDMDLYTAIFIQASKNKTGGQWMLLFDAKTNKLLKIVYEKSSGGNVFYKP